MRFLVAVLTCLVASSAVAQPSGVLLHDNGGDAFRGGVAISNASATAPHTVSLLPRINGDQGGFADSLFGRPIPVSRLRAGEASMSPGGRVAFTANWFGPNLLVVQNRDATGRELLTDTTATTRGETTVSELGDIHPAVSPDGQQVAFLSNRFWEDAGDGNVGNVFTVPASGGDPVQLTASETVTLPNDAVRTCKGFSRVVWSPDGSQLAFIGSRAARRSDGSLTTWGCTPTVGTMNPDGSGVTLLRQGGFGADTPYTPTEWVLSWTAGGLFYFDSRTGAFELMSPTGAEIRQLPQPSDIGGFSVRLDNEWALSPDGQHVATTATDGSIVIADLDFTLVERIETTTGGSRFIDWVDAPLTPAPDRIELASSPDLIWGGIEAAVQPTVYDATGNVIVVGARNWTGSGAALTTPRLNRFTGTLFGSTSNHLDRELCAHNAGLTACFTYDNVHRPIVTAEMDAAEITEGGAPATVTVRRYGNPVAIAVSHRMWGGAIPFRDVMLGGSASVLALAEGQTEARIPLFAIADGVAEGTETTIFQVLTDDAYVRGVPWNPSASVLDDGISATELGLTAVTPQRGTAGGRVTLSVSGRAFETGATLSLDGPGGASDAEDVLVVSPNELRATVALPTAVGARDVVVTNPGGAEAVLSNAFNADSPPSTGRVRLSATLTGPGVRIPTNIGRPFRIVITNHSGEDVHGVLGFVRVPAAVTVSASGVYSGSGFEGTPWAPSEDWKILPFWLYRAPAKQSVSFEINVTAPVELVGQTAPVLLSIVGPPEDEAFTFSGDFSDAPFEIPYTLRGVFGAGFRVQAGAGGGPLSEYVGRLGRTPGGTVGVPAPSDCDEPRPFTTSDFDSNVAAVESAQANQLQAAIDLVQAAVVGQVLNLIGVFIPVRGPAEAVVGGEAMNRTYNKLTGTESFTDAGKRILTDEQQRCPDVIQSYDPNDKLGPIGVGPAGHLRPDAPFDYTVRFENLAAATAPAQQVFVVDTLDSSVYDLSSFELGPVAFGDTVVTPPPGLRHWTTEVDLRPDVPVTVVVHAALDEAAGVARWTFSALDPDTGGLPFDPGIGFLPPNMAPPEGEGSVAFSIALLDALADGAVIENQAEIVFDRNEPIVTPVWRNTIDLVAPVSQVVAAEATETDDTYQIRWQAADGGAGVRRTTVYVSKDGGAFEPWITGSDTTAVFVGEPGAEYGFFSLAVDGAGNPEPPKTDAEATTQGSVDAESKRDLPSEVVLAAPYPNPAPEGAVVQFGLPQPGRADVRVFDVRGREVARLVDERRDAGWHRERLDVSALAPGVYVVRLMADGTVDTQTLTIVR